MVYSWEKGVSMNNGIRLVTPIWDMRYWDRFEPQMEAVRRFVESIDIIYITGDVPRNRNFQFHKFKLPSGALKSMTMRLFFYKKSILSKYDSIDIDAVYVLNSVFSQQFSSALARRHKVPYVLRLRGNFKDVRNNLGTGFLKKIFLNYLEASTIREANVIIPNSYKLQEFAFSLNCRNVTTPIFQGVDTDHFKIMRKVDDKFTLLYIGRLRREKGIYRLLDLSKNFPSIRFLVAGRNQDNITNFPENVTYLGRVPFSDIPNIYSMADIVLLPSYTEGFSNVLVEAYACGKPIFATHEAFPEGLKLFGELHHFPEWQKRISEMEKGDRIIFSPTEARQYVTDHFSWGNFGMNIVTHIENACSNIVE